MELTKEQLAAKIALDIVKYETSSPQAQLSLLQDLLIEFLPQVEHGSSSYMRLMSVRCHHPAENVNEWLTPLMSEYLKISAVKSSLDSLTADDQNKSY